MPIYTDVETRLNRRALEATASELRTAFGRLGDDISRGFGGKMSGAFGALDTRATRAELASLEGAWTRAADAEATAAARMVSSARQVEVAQARAAEMSERYAETHSKAIAANAALADTQARSARDQRVYTDTLVANEAAHQSHTRAMEESAGAAAGMGRAFSAAGIGSVAVFTGTVLEAGKAAGDFQQHMTKLHAAAGIPAQDLKTISDGILHLSGQVGYSTAELSNAMFTVSKAGYSAADGMKVLQAAAQGANAEQAPLPEVVNALTTSLQDFHVPADQAAKVMSQMVTAVGESKVPLQEFAGALHTIEPTAAQLHLSLSDIWGVLAQVTQSGTSADQAADQMNNTMRAMSGANAPARQSMQQLGINADDVSQKLGERGLAGTLQYLYSTIAAKVDPSTKLLDTGELLKSTQAVQDQKNMLDQMSPSARGAAEALHNHTMTHIAYLKAVRGSNEADAVQMHQYEVLEDKISGFSKRLTGGRESLETLNQAINDVTGTMSGAAITLQTTGDHAGETSDRIKKIADTAQEADGTVKGFNESQETLNAKMRDAKAAFGAAEAEIGAVFVPALTDAANAAKDVGEWMGKHPAIMHDVVDAIGIMGGAWLAIKGYGIAETILTPIVGGLGKVLEKLGGVELQAVTAGNAMRGMGGAAAEGVAGVETAAAAEVAAEGRVAVAAGEADAAMAAGGAAGGAGGGGRGRGTRAFLGALPVVGTTAMALQEGAEQINPNNNPENRADSGWGNLLFGKSWDWLPGHAGGGPLHAPGPKGVDSGVFRGADGEHVFTHPEVQKMGGHQGVYRFRSDLMNNRVMLSRAGGGPVGPDVSAAESMSGIKYSQANRNDCSGMVGRVVEAATGMGGALPTTQNMQQFLAARGFVPGVGGPGTMSVGWYNHGSGANQGHAAMTLSDGENAESGGSHGNFLVGGSVGASSSQFDHHMYLPNLYGEGEGGSGGGMGGGRGGGGGGGFGGGMGGGGGVPAGSTAGRGPGGQAGYYTPNPERVASAQERLRHIDEEIRIAEERKNTLKAGASQAQKDRLDEEIRHLKTERDQEEGRLHKAEQGTFHQSRGGGRGGGGNSPFLPVPLADKFGLDKGLPGVAEWAVGFLEDLVLGPLETGAMAAMNGGGFGMGAGAPDGGAGAGMPGTDALKVADAGGGGAGGSDSSGGGAGASSGPGQWWGGKWHRPGVPGMDMVSPGGTAPGGAPHAAGPHGWASGDGAPGTQMPGNWPRPGHAYTNSPYTPGTNEGQLDWGKQRPSAPMFPWSPRPKSDDGGQRGVNPGAVQHHAKGGPAGTDTIPSWLSPGEEVEQKSAVDKYGAPFMEALNDGQFDPSIVQYHDLGLGTGGAPQAPPPPLPPAGPKTADAVPQNPGSSKPQGAPQQQSLLKVPGSGGGAKALPPSGPGQNGQAGDPGSAPVGATQSGSGVDVHPDQSNESTPGATDQRPGAGLPASQGIGFSGGIIGGVEGAVEGAASAAASMGSFGGAGGAASAAMQVGFQELNRAAAAGAQAAGVGVEGLLETIIPDSSGTGGDWMKTIPGRLLGGIAGSRPAGQNTAGQTQPSVAGGGQQAQYSGMGQQGPASGGMNIENLHVQADDHQGLVNSLNSEAAMAGHSTGANSGWVSGRGGNY